MDGWRTTKGKGILEAQKVVYFVFEGLDSVMFNILVLQLGIEPMTPIVEGQILDHQGIPSSNCNQF